MINFTIREMDCYLSVNQILNYSKLNKYINKLKWLALYSMHKQWFWNTCKITDSDEIFSKVADFCVVLWMLFYKLFHLLT